MKIRAYKPADEIGIVDLWHQCDLVRPWNDPHLDIRRKLDVQPELFLVAEQGSSIVGTVMCGYEGHRGWVNYLAVSPALQGNGLGRRLMRAAESALEVRGCPKLNIQVRSTNEAVLAFYNKLGYTVDPVVSLGKRLIQDTQQ
ncbi:MAG: GNAT family acetyltransferase [Oceanococcus sp.]|nr:MAG: GNAT family acetyltransferase [Oceanococcus sp.]